MADICYSDSVTGIGLKRWIGLSYTSVDRGDDNIETKQY